MKLNLNNPPPPPPPPPPGSSAVDQNLARAVSEFQQMNAPTRARDNAAAWVLPEKHAAPPAPIYGTRVSRALDRALDLVELEERSRRVGVSDPDFKDNIAAVRGCVLTFRSRARAGRRGEIEKRERRLRFGDWPRANWLPRGAKPGGGRSRDSPISRRANPSPEKKLRSSPVSPAGRI
eukprot:8145599-Pyramimonas_sp.AAC.1